MSFKKSLLALSSLVLFMPTIALSQQPETTAPVGEQQGLRRRGPHKERRRLGQMRTNALGLSDAQRQQLREIRSRIFENTRTQREELFSLRRKRVEGTFSDTDAARAKELRQQLRESMRSVHSDVQGIFTEEQRAKLQQMRLERMERRELRMQRRHERREMRDRIPQ
jgi:Spy/CpxP family protein refolding chaperone